MSILIIVTFILGYTFIVLEHPLKLDKTVPTLLMGAIMWAILSIGFHNGLLDIVDTHEHLWNISGGHEADEGFVSTLVHHLGKTSEILFFLMGAMTIVEIIDLHAGFEVLKSYIKTKNKKKLLWMVGIVAFFLSAVIDNLTATIVLVTLLRKLIHSKKERLWYAALIVIAANAGGAWSPIGDVTTTMLWIGNKTTAAGLIKELFLPSLLSFAVPFFIATLLPVFKGNLQTTETEDEPKKLLSSKVMLYLGLSMIIFVPFFKTITHLPPYLGMMFSLGVVWLVSEYIHPEENFDSKNRHLYSGLRALSRIELSSILFFLGILMAVASMETLATQNMGTLKYLAVELQKSIPNQYIVISILGVFSAIIDNVPLVAATMGMYTFPIDHHLWHFIAYAAGTGGSMLIIGSAAGVAAMGMEKIDFIWYFKKVTVLAVLGYVAGIAAFILWSVMFLHG
ncbi:MAG TPA: sodium:proton antiporter [Bacteroidetes bacterium]|nr:sodium:proton antiporter [Bacteroidota bacterium]